MTEDEQRERRREHPDQARARRAAQQQQWERQAKTGGTHITEAFANALGALVEAGAHLPACDRSARLHAGVKRISEASDRTQAHDAARALLHTSELALADDPWMRFHHAAMELVLLLE